MRNISKVIIIFSFFSLINVKSEESLFMSDEESQKILSFVENNKNKCVDSCEFKLSGIVFIDDLNWVVWINNKPYNSIGEKEDFSLDEVNENNVVITRTDGKTLNLSVD